MNKASIHNEWHRRSLACDAIAHPVIGMCGLARAAQYCIEAAGVTAFTANWRARTVRRHAT
jgi:hypothetical protein